MCVCVCVDWDASFSYILPAQLLLSDLSRPTADGLSSSALQIHPPESRRYCIFPYILGVQKKPQTFWRYIHTLLGLVLSSLHSFVTDGVLLLGLLPNVMLLPCIRAPLDGQLDLLGDERGPGVAGGAELRAQPFVSLHVVSLEAWRGPASLRST